MQLNQAELDRARDLWVDANGKARERLFWVVRAFEWALEDPGRESPALAAAQVDPLDHDGDGKKGGSEKGEAATARKRRKAK